MVGGSLQSRLDLKPRDVKYLTSMGQFSAAPKALTWRQKLHAISQALEALLYLHTRTPCILHRDFKPGNILLDASLQACLGDTGFAKAAQRSGDASQLGGATTGRVMGSPGYAHKDVLAGRYSEFTEAYAVGVTLLVVLTHREPVDIEEMIEEDHDLQPFAEIPAARIAEAGAAWTAEAAGAIKELYTRLCVVRKRNQLKLPDVQRALQSLLNLSGSPASGADTTATTTDASVSLAGPACPRPLSLQVRGMRCGDGLVQSVQRNVSEAFDSCIRRLDEIYKVASRQPPNDFVERIDFWHAECGLDDEIRARMHKLRIWRNASLHHDEQRWAHDGPRSAEAALTFIADLDARLQKLAGKLAV